MSPLGVQAQQAMGSDIRQYLASAQAGDCEAVRVACSAIEDPEFEGECVAEMASRCGYQERAQVLVDCEALASPHWRGECFFNLADLDSHRGAWDEAGPLCRRSAPFVADCLSHVLILKARRMLFDQFGPASSQGGQGGSPGIANLSQSTSLDVTLNASALNPVLPRMVQDFDLFATELGLDARSGPGLLPKSSGEYLFNVVFSRLNPLDVDACMGLGGKAGTRCRRAVARELGVRLRNLKGTLDEKSSAEFCMKLQKANRQGAVDILGVHYQGNPDLEEELRSVRVETCGGAALPMTSPPARSPP